MYEKAHEGPHEPYIQLMEVHKASLLIYPELTQSFAIKKAYTLNQNKHRSLGLLKLSPFAQGVHVPFSDQTNTLILVSQTSEANRVTRKGPDKFEVSSTNLLFCVIQGRLFAQYSHLVSFLLPFKISGSTKVFFHRVLETKNLFNCAGWTFVGAMQ